MVNDIILESIVSWIRESMSVSKLPKDLVNSLLTELYPKDRKGSYSIKDIERENKEAREWFNYKRKDLYGKLDPEEIKNMKDQEDFTNKNKLIGIYSYINGDTAWFSFKDKKVYDFNHEIGKFNDIIDHEFIKKVESSVHYKQWIKDVKSGKHDEAWRVN